MLKSHVKIEWIISKCILCFKKSDKAKRCDGINSAELKSIEGFTCPGSSEIGPNGLLQEHPVYPHPTDCQYFFTCFFGKEPNKFGCSNGQVFDAQVSANSIQNFFNRVTSDFFAGQAL